MSTARHPDPVVQELVDREAIKELKARYFRLIDTKAWDEFPDLFTDDCVHWLPEESPTPTMTNADYFAMTRELLTPGVTVHHGHMSELTFDGPDEARGTWAMEDFVQVDPPSGRISIQGYGHYHETYRRCDDGRWRISSKRNTRLWVHPAAWTLPESPDDAG